MFYNFNFSLINIKNNDSLILEIIINNNYIKRHPFIFEIFNNYFNNFYFLVGNTNYFNLFLDLSNNNYNYKIFDSLNNLIESGELNIKEFFECKIEKIEPHNVTFVISGNFNGFIDSFLYLGNVILENKKIKLKNTNLVYFNDLNSNSKYKVIFKSEDYFKTIEFTTPYNNISFNKPIKGTFTRLPESKFIDDSTPAISRINDGKIEWYSGMANSGEILYEDQFFIINLLSNYSIKKICVYWNANNYPLSYSIIYSCNENDWYNIVRTTNYYIDFISIDNSSVKLDEFETNIQAKYIGIFIDKNQKIYNRFPMRNYVSLIEFIVYE